MLEKIFADERVKSISISKEDRFAINTGRNDYVIIVENAFGKDFGTYKEEDDKIEDGIKEYFCIRSDTIEEGFIKVQEKLKEYR